MLCSTGSDVPRFPGRLPVSLYHGPPRHCPVVLSVLCCSLNAEPHCMGRLCRVLKSGAFPPCSLTHCDLLLAPGAG